MRGHPFHHERRGDTGCIGGALVKERIQDCLGGLIGCERILNGIIAAASTPVVTIVGLMLLLLLQLVQGRSLVVVNGGQVTTGRGGLGGSKRLSSFFW